MAVGSEDWGEPAVLSAERKRKQLEVGKCMLTWLLPIAYCHVIWPIR